MYKFPIGVIVENFKTDIYEGIKKASELGVDGIQMYAVSGEFSPQNITEQKRIDLLDRVKSQGLCFSAICGDFGIGFSDKQKNQQLIEQSKRILYLAKQLETDIVTTHVGVIPQNKNDDRYKIMQQACFELCEYADSIGGYFAIETGPEKAIVLKDFLDELGSKGVGVNLDPANFVMVTGDDPIEAVYTLSDYIVHTHAKDGRKLLDVGADVIYGPKDNKIGLKAYEEMPLGDGDVNFEGYLKALRDIGYKGFLTIEKNQSENPDLEIQKAVIYLKNNMLSESC